MKERIRVLCQHRDTKKAEWKEGKAARALTKKNITAARRAKDKAEKRWSKAEKDFVIPTCFIDSDEVKNNANNISENTIPMLIMLCCIQEVITEKQLLRIVTRKHIPRNIPSIKEMYMNEEMVCVCVCVSHY